MKTRFRAVVDMLSRIFAISEASLPTFVARLQQLQRLGVPGGTNCGRTSSADYTPGQVLELALVLDLLDLGVAPAAAKQTLNRVLKPEITDSIIAGLPLRVLPSGLNHLRAELKQEPSASIVLDVPHRARQIFEMFLEPSR